MFKNQVIGAAWMLTAALGVHTCAIAAPIVSKVEGVIGVGKTLVVTGSGFGSKPQAAPLLWDDFEAGASGALIQNVSARLGRWDSGTGSDAVRYTNAVSRAGKQSSKHDFIATTNASLAKNFAFPLIYLDFWVRPDAVENVSRNWKVWRLFGASDQLQMSATYQCEARFTQIEDQAAAWSKTFYSGTSYRPGVWHHVQLIYKQSTPGATDGVIRSIIDSKAFGADSAELVTRMGERSFSQLRIGHYWARDAISGCASNSGAFVYVDDVYIDTSWARVELGNSPTYESATHREILIPRVWSDGRIEVFVSDTKFPPGAKMYLFVTDAKNVTQSVGTPLGEGSAVSEPNPPSSFVIE